MTVPTEAEIREAIASRATLWPHDDPRKALRGAVEGFASFMTSPAYDAFESPDPRIDLDDDADDIWRDLRPSEARSLDELARAAIERAVRVAEAAIVEELVNAGLAFAGAYPEAPRARPKALAASR